jgi:hypothetical protein
MNQAMNNKKGGAMKIILIILGVIALCIGGCVLTCTGGAAAISAGIAKAEEEKLEFAKSLKDVSAGDLSAASLSEIFSYGEKYTDIQRENKEAEIKGEIVEWELAVYDVKKTSDGIYRIQTSQKSGSVGTFIDLYTFSPEEVSRVESLVSDDNIKFRGKITGTSMRNIEIEPAILLD